MSNADATRPSQAQTNTLHALAIVAALHSAGVRHAVLSPGSRNTPLVFACDAFERAQKLQLHVAIDERVAGFIALGIARATGEPVALVCTSGSAGAHWLPAIAEAFRARLPLIAITADRPDELHGRGAPQTMPQERLFESLSLETLALSAPAPGQDRRVDVSQKVLHIASKAQADQGPVHVNVALREPLWDPSCDPLFHELPTAYPQVQRLVARGRATPADAAIQDALREPLQRGGAIYVGPIDAGHFRQRAGESGEGDLQRFRAALEQLATAADWPVFCDAASVLRTTDDPSLLGADVFFREDAIADPAEMETLIVVGPWPTSKPLGLWLERHPQVRVVSIPGPGANHDPWFRVSLTIEGDLTEILDAASASFSTPLSTQRRELWQRRSDVAQQTLESFCQANDTFEGAIARAVSQAVQGPATLHIGSSMPIRDVDTYGAKLQAGVQVCASRGVNGIDGNIATSLGAALATKEPAVLLLGDIAFRHDIGALAHACGQDVALTIVVVDNAGGGIFRHLAVSAAEARFERYFLTPQASRIDALATGCGARVHRSDGARAIAELLPTLQHQPGVDVILVEVDGDQQVALRQAAVAQTIAATRALAADTAP